MVRSTRGFGTLYLVKKGEKPIRRDFVERVKTSELFGYDYGFLVNTNMHNTGR